MATLTSDYQYLGRSGKLGSTYYLLVYGKTTPNTTTGIHRVYVQVKFASTQAGTTFYSFANTIKATVNGSNAFSVSKKPSSAWANTGKITVGGTTYGASVTIGTGYVDIDATDGAAKTVTIKAEYTHGSASQSYTPSANETDSYSGSHTLSAIIRKAQFTAADDFNDEGNPTITYKNDASSVTTLVQAGISFDGTNMVVPYRDVTLTGGTYTFNLTDAERNALRNGCTDANSKTVQFMLKSTVGSNNFTDSISKTLSIINANPTATWTSATEKDAEILASSIANLGTFLKGVSDVEVKVTPSLKKGATLKSVKFTHNGTNLLNNPSTFSNIQTNSFSCEVVDSRNNSVTISKTVSLLDYVILNISTINIYRDTVSDPTKILIDANINYFNNSFSSTIVNTPVLTIKNSAGTSKTITNYTITGNTIVLDGVDTGFNLAEAATDSYTLTVSDKIMTKTATKAVSLLIPTFEMGEHDVQVNGDLYVASSTRTNPVNVLSAIGTLNNLKTAEKSSLTGAINEVFDKLYPVGSVYIMSTNVNPNTIGIPGTWTFVDKEFKTAHYNIDNISGGFTNGSASAHTIYLLYSGHDIIVTGTITSNTSLADSTVTLGTINPAKVGAVQHFSMAHRWVGYADGANGAAMLQVSYLGEIQSVDAIDVTSLTSGAVLTLETTIGLQPSLMADSWCDKFYYKRTA